MKVYATTDEGRRFLLSIRCDGPGCESEIKPNPDISQSGWVWYGQDHGPGTSRLEWDYCPDCGLGPCKIDWDYPDGPGWKYEEKV